MDKQAEVFQLVAGEMPGKADLEMLARIEKVLCLQRHDAFWVALITLQAYMKLLTRIPDQVSKSSESVMREVREAARMQASIEVSRAIQASSAGLAQAQAATMERGHNDQGAPWFHGGNGSGSENGIGVLPRTWLGAWARRLKGFGILLLGCAIAGSMGYWLGEQRGTESGFKQGYAYMRDEQAAKAWSATALGMKAYRMFNGGVLEMLVTCGGKGWKISHGICTPLAVPGEGTYGWPMPRELPMSEPRK